MKNIITEMADAMNEFCHRVEIGEVQSTYTYQKFKHLMNSYNTIDPNDKNPLNFAKWVEDNYMKHIQTGLYYAIESSAMNDFDRDGKTDVIGYSMLALVVLYEKQ